MTTPEGARARRLEATEHDETPNTASSDIEAELLAAERDFENGDYIEVTLEQLEHCAKTGESPWPGESPENGRWAR